MYLHLRHATPPNTPILPPFHPYISPISKYPFLSSAYSSIIQFNVFFRASGRRQIPGLTFIPCLCCRNKQKGHTSCGYQGLGTGARVTTYGWRFSVALSRFRRWKCVPWIRGTLCAMGDQCIGGEAGVMHWCFWGIDDEGVYFFFVIEWEYGNVAVRDGSLYGIHYCGDGESEFG